MKATTRTKTTKQTTKRLPKAKALILEHKPTLVKPKEKALPLTKEMKHIILNAMAHIASKQRKEELDKQGEELAYKIITARCGRGWRQRVAKLPEGWLTQVNRVEVRLGHDGYQATGQGFLALYLKEYMPVPNIGIYGNYTDKDGIRIQVEDHFSPELWEELLAWGKARHFFSRDLYTVQEQIRSALAGIRTVRQLEELWPEAYKHIPKEHLKRTNTQVMVNYTYLNQVLDSFSKAGGIEQPADKHHISAAGRPVAAPISS